MIFIDVQTVLGIITHLSTNHLIRIILRYYLSSWRCPLCTEYSSFPEDPRFHDQLERKKTFECTQQYVEYVLEDQTHDNNPPKILYTFVIDLSGTNEYFQNLQSNIIQSLSHLPEYGSFCLITIGARIGLYDLSQTIPRVVVYILIIIIKIVFKWKQ